MLFNSSLVHEYVYRRLIFMCIFLLERFPSSEGMIFDTRLRSESKGQHQRMKYV